MAKQAGTLPVNTTESRLSSVETQIDNIVSGLDSLNKKVDTLGAAISSSHRLDWASIWGGIACLLVVIGAGGTAWIAPIYTQIDFAKNEWAENKQEMRELRTLATSNRAMIEKHAAVVGAKLTEVETQFDWLNDIVNMRDRNAHLLTAILWENTFSKPLPEPSLPNAGPGTSHESRANHNGFHQ